ncbi:MAG: flagellar basal body-associated FliL family protein [Deltaproteobacteria bacterium]|jgi:flagellar FliL protein|nr:flagellar basal body-associated FliL family protein [Deltaproteobacteria bacterium]
MAEKKGKPTKPAPEAEAPAAAPPAAAEAPPKKGGGRMKLIIIVVAAMVIGGAGAFAAMKFLLAPAAPQAESGDEFAQTAPAGHGTPAEEPIVAPTKGEAPASGGHGSGGGEGGEGEGAAEADGPQTVDLKPFATNLNENSGRRYLKVTISMEVDNKAAADELNRLMPDIQDKILMQLSSLTSQDVFTVDGKERLRSQILRLTNSVMVDNKVRKVKYSEFIIQ